MKTTNEWQHLSHIGQVHKLAPGKPSYDPAIHNAQFSTRSLTRWPCSLVGLSG